MSEPMKTLSGYLFEKRGINKVPTAQSDDNEKGEDVESTDNSCECLQCMPGTESELKLMSMSAVENKATFGYTTPLVVIPLKVWESLGRPATISIKITPIT